MKRHKVMFSNGMETSVKAGSLKEMKWRVREVWEAFWWKEESVVVVEEETGRRWVGEKSSETGWWPKWKEVK